MSEQRKPNRLETIRQSLNRSIYVGERLQENMRILRVISLFCAVLGLILIVINSLTGQTMMLITSVFTFLSGIACWYCAAVLKDRSWAIMIPTLFSLIFCTVYAFTGAAEGSAILWSLLVPIGMCYFVSVRGGILLSAFYSLLYFVLFYTPLGASLSMYYNDKFMARFPIVYLSLSVFTGISMYQYHQTALLEIDYTHRLNEEVKRQTAVAEERSHRIEQMSLATIHTLANAIDAKDPFSKGHSTRVSQYAALLAESLGWPRERVSDLRYAAMLHDIGKIGVPDSILSKPRRLTDVEYGIVKSHTYMGADTLREKIVIDPAEAVARSHHERYDGKGYPDGLRGEEIPLEARIVAIADAFDAMNSDRVFRKAYDSEYILNELLSNRGSQFDPALTDRFVSLWQEGKLNGILARDAVEENEGMEAPSALLQEVMDSFISQNAADSVDIITGLMGRTAGETAIARAMKETDGCLVFFDMDNLKKINDIHGHDAGDLALKLLGDVFRDNGSGMIGCRLGGDEFLVFFKEVSRSEAESRVRKILEDYECRKRDNPKIGASSLSAGLAMTAVSDAYVSAYNNADKALYYVKQNGKNSYSFFNSDSESYGSDLVDLNRLVQSIRNSGNYSGAMDVEYRQFARLYEFVANLKTRFNQPFLLGMITLEPNAEDAARAEDPETAMYYMEQAIRQAIRNVDVLTRYSRLQFLIIFLGTDQKGVRTAMDRIYREYYKMNGNTAFSPVSAIADPDAE